VVSATDRADPFARVDGRGFAEIGQRDPVAARLLRRFPGLRTVCFYSAYEAATWAIISQRINMKQAAAVKTRLAESAGELVSIHGQPMRAFPDRGCLRTCRSLRDCLATKPPICVQSPTPPWPATWTAPTSGRC